MATWALSTLCTVGDIRERLTSPEIALQLSPDANIDSIIQGKSVLAKDWIRQKLINYFQVKIPARLSQFLAFKRSQIDKYQSEFARNMELLDRGSGSWNVPVNTYYMGYDGLYFDITNYATLGINPVLRFFSGVPANGSAGTYAGLAKNGDVLIAATSLNSNNITPYINRSATIGSVSWNVFDVRDALDNILNISELRHAAVSATIIAMLQDGSLRNRVDYQDAANAQFMANTLQDYYKDYTFHLSQAMSILDVDFDGDGIISDWERGFTISERAIAG